MTCQERSQYYKAREAYRRKCEDFREELSKYLSNIKPHNHENLLQKHHIGLDRDQAGLLPGAMPQPGLQADSVPLPKP